LPKDKQKELAGNLSAVQQSPIVGAILCRHGGSVAQTAYHFDKEVKVSHPHATFLSVPLAATPELRNMVTRAAASNRKGPVHNPLSAVAFHCYTSGYRGLEKGAAKPTKEEKPTGSGDEEKRIQEGQKPEDDDQTFPIAWEEDIQDTMTAAEATDASQRLPGFEGFGVLGDNIALVRTRVSAEPGATQSGVLHSGSHFGVCFGLAVFLPKGSFLT
jgi:hypothetical protein